MILQFELIPFKGSTRLIYECTSVQKHVYAFILND